MPDLADVKSFQFREATVADREAILALRQRCFPGQDQEKLDPRFWDWEFSNSPAGPGLSYLAEVNGRAVAHFALVPQTYVVDGACVPAAMAIDAMTDPQLRGRGVYTRLHAYALDHAKSRFRFGVAYQIRRPALAPLLRNGWSPRLKLPVLVRPVSLRKLVTRGGPVGQAGSAVHWTPEELAAVALEFFTRNTVHQHRSPRYFSWRYRQNPLWKYEVRVRRAESDVLAYLITRRTNLKGFSTLALVDMAWRRGHDRDAAAILGDAIRDAPAQLAAALITTSHPAFSLLLRTGFLPGPHRFRFLLREIDPTGMVPLRASRWALMWGDTDHL